MNRAFAHTLICLAVLAAAGPASADRGTHTLWSETPVVFSESIEKNLRYADRHWSHHVYPMGNGRLGFTVFGNPAKLLMKHS